MTKEEREVMRMALEALEDWDNWSDHTPKKTTEAIIAIDKCLANNALEKKAENAKELGLDYEPNKNEFKPDWDEKLALTEEVISLSKRIEELEAQPSVSVEQDRFLVATIGNWGRVEWADGIFPSLGDKMYSAPPKWVRLTDAEVKKIVGSDRYTDLLLEVVKIVEAKLKEKNT